MRVRLAREDERGPLAASADASLDALASAMQEIRDEAVALASSTSTSPSSL